MTSNSVARFLSAQAEAAGLSSDDGLGGLVSGALGGSVGAQMGGASFGGCGTMARGRLAGGDDAGAGGDWAKTAVPVDGEWGKPMGVAGEWGKPVVDWAAGSPTAPVSALTGVTGAPQVEIPLPPSGPDVQKGTIEKIFATFGFIFGYNGGRYFFHFGTCVTKPELLKAGDEVEFLMGPDKKSGRLHAQRVYRRPTAAGLPELLERRIPNPAAAPNKQANPNHSASSAHWTPSVATLNKCGTWRQRSSDASGQPDMALVSQIASLLRGAVAQEAERTERAVVTERTTPTTLTGLVAAMLEGGAFLIEFSDHSQLVYAARSTLEDPTEALTRGSELAFRVQTHNQGALTEVFAVHKLPTHTLTADFVMGGEELRGRVVAELEIGGERACGAVEVVRGPGDRRPTRTYPFSLLSLRDPHDVSALTKGSLVSFHLQVEGAHQRAALLKPISVPLQAGQSGAGAFVAAPEHWTRGALGSLPGTPPLTGSGSPGSPPGSLHSLPSLGRTDSSDQRGQPSPASQPDLWDSSSAGSRSPPPKTLLPTAPHAAFPKTTTNIAPHTTFPKTTTNLTRTLPASLVVENGDRVLDAFLRNPAPHLGHF